MQTQKFDRNLLVNIAKGTTAWAGLTSVIALPALLDPHPVESFILGCLATGVVFPLGIYAATSHKKGNYFGKFYVDLFDQVFRCSKDKQR